MDISERRQRDNKFEKRTLENGKPNASYIDFLAEDKVIPRQQYGVFSFLSPWNILKDKKLFYFTEFVKTWSILKYVQTTTGFLHFISRKYNLNVENLIKDYTEFMTAEKQTIEQETSIKDDFDTFMDKNEEALEERFDEANEFQTSILGFKPRGNFATVSEAERYAKTLRDNDIGHITSVCKIGVWNVWDPNPSKVQRSDYLEPELNRLHQEKDKNDAKAKELFEQRRREIKQKAIEENMKLAEQTGNKLTQTLSPSGDLIGVQDTTNFEAREVADPKVAVEIAQKLVEAANKPLDDSV
jgi:hypothetical protein